jgi:hypothetical protein
MLKSSGSTPLDIACISGSHLPSKKIVTLLANGIKKDRLSAKTGSLERIQKVTLPMTAFAPVRGGEMMI